MTKYHTSFKTISLEGAGIEGNSCIDIKSIRTLKNYIYKAHCHRQNILIANEVALPHDVCSLICELDSFYKSIQFGSFHIQRFGSNQTLQYWTYPTYRINFNPKPDLIGWE